MKKFVFCLMAAAAFLAACERETIADPQETSVADPQEEAPLSNAKSVTVYAGGPGTKTAITESNGQFSLNWSEGDQIAVWETVPYIATLQQDTDYNGDVSVMYESDPLTTTASAAVFHLNLEGRNDVVGHGDIHYVAIYPASCAVEVPGWDGGGSGRMLIPLNMPEEQHPTADSFDPNADILVSKAVTCQDTRPDELSFQFARVGTIVKMTIADLPPGARITDGGISLGFESSYYFVYDPQNECIVSNDGSGTINFWYNPGLTVGSDGKATIWLRSMSGVSQSLRLNLSYVSNGELYGISRFVSLKTLNKTLEFKEGGLTEFTIGLPVPDVDNPEEDSIDYEIDSDTGSITFFWPASTDEDFAGYECALVDEAGRWHYFTSRTIIDGTFYGTIDSGLEPGGYTLYIRTLAVNGKVSNPDHIEVYMFIGNNE